MAVTIQQIGKFLDENDIHYALKDDSTLITGFTTPNFRDCDDNEKHILIVVKLEEDGEYFKCFAPMAFKATGEHARAFLEACMSIQWQTKLIQFEYDAGDGEIRPIIEFPIADGTLTARQVVRCVHALVQIVDDNFDTLDRAMKTGVIDFSKTQVGKNHLDSLIANIRAMVSSGMITQEIADDMIKKIQASEGPLAPDTL